MTIVCQTILDRVEYSPRIGAIGFRLEKMVVNTDTGAVVSTEFHRSVVQDVVDRSGKLIGAVTVGDQLDRVNTHLAELGFPPMSPADQDIIVAVKDIHARAVPVEVA